MTEIQRERTPGSRRPRVLLIDYNEQLAEILAELLADDGLEVIRYNSPPDECSCTEKVLQSEPDLIVVNLAQPAGWGTDLQGWRCLQQIHENPATQRYPAVGYSILDAYSLNEMNVNATALGVKVQSGLNNPGQFADEVAKVAAIKPAA